MADAALEFLLVNVQQLLLYNVDLIKDGKRQVDMLENDLRLFKSFFNDSTKRRRKDDTLRVLIQQICEVIYEAEDVIDVFITQAVERRNSKNILRRALQAPVDLRTIVQQVKDVSSKVIDYYSRLTLADRGPQELIKAPVLREDNVVGFEDEMEKIMGYLTKETEQLDVITITGMAGLGKTTLAWKIFRDPRIQYIFPIREWVYVSQEFTTKDVFLSIIEKFTRFIDEYHRKTEAELARLVAAMLKTEKFLIVFDDVWTAGDWDRIQTALPKSNKKGKVLITSRHEEMARFASRSRPPHKLRFLTQDESWRLLQLEVLGEPNGSSELDVPGKVIAEQCDGLALAIVVIGGILAKQVSALIDPTATKNAWEKVSKNVSTYLNEDPERSMENILALSYDTLPYHMRACFLYLGMFPQNFEIPVGKLIRMWIAEGFIQQNGGMSLEETAETYLVELINRNLIQIDKTRHDGRVKTCRMQPLLHHFCRTEGGIQKENFLQQVNKSSENILAPRICIYSNVLDFISSKPSGPRVRSFVYFSDKEVLLQNESISAFPAAFKLLRVLDVMPIKFTKIPRDMFHLVHLKYVVLSFINLAVLPAAFSKLWNLQTVKVETTSPTLEIKADIWKMIQLRHLKTNVSTTLPKTGKSHKEGENLQELGVISPQSCTKEVFDRARNLKKLGIHGRLALLLDGKAGSFDTLKELSNLETLKLLNDESSHSPSESELGSLFKPDTFPPNLKSLTLSSTSLSWSRMHTLGLLENLEVLKLKDKAFVGKRWEAVDGGFRRLKVLHIGCTDLVDWVGSRNHFPTLKCLELWNCEQLNEVPIELAYISSFQVLDLFHTKKAAASAMKIKDAKQVKAGQTLSATAFKLSIHPLEE